MTRVTLDYMEATDKGDNMTMTRQIAASILASAGIASPSEIDRSTTAVLVAAAEGRVVTPLMYCGSWDPTDECEQGGNYCEYHAGRMDDMDWDLTTKDARGRYVRTVSPY